MNEPMKNIPVVLVVYNRAKHTLEVLKALKEHNISNLYIFSDAPKSGEDAEAVSLTRRLVHSIDWTKPKIVERTENFGLARNIVNAVDTVFQEFERLILLEDDCIPQRHFFDFMRTCLDRYENDPKVFGISGYTVPLPDEILRKYPYDLYFCPRIGSWGWGTWKRAWQKRGNDVHELIDTAVMNGIDLEQGGTDIPVALDNMLKGVVKDVWTLHWVLSVYLNNGVYIYPTRSHIRNVGMDGTGVHCKTTDKYDSPCCDTRPVNYPGEVFLDKDIMAIFRSYYDVDPAKRAAVRPATKAAESEAPMKICYINAGDIKGGAHRVGWMLKQGLKHRGFQTVMFVKNKMSTDPQVKIITDPALDGGTDYADQGYMYYDIKSTFRLISQPEFSTCDVAHFHNLHGNYFNPFALPDLTKSRPSVWTLHDMHSMTGHCAYAFDCAKWQTGCGNCPHPEAYPPIAKDRTAEMWRDKKVIYRESDFELIVPSQWLKDIVEKSMLKNKRVHLIYNGIDERIYRPLDKHVIRQALKVPPNAVIISFVAHGGLIDKRKGGDFILETYNYLTAKYPNVFFICVGGRSNQAPTERFVQVPFLLDEEKLVQLYCAADIFLFPTLADNCPLVVLEVMGCGTPIVSFNTGGVPELIEHEKTGLIAGYRNGEEFIKMAECLVVDGAKRQAFGAAGRERLLRMFTLEQMIDKHVALYERLAEEGKKKNYIPSKSKAVFPAAIGGRQYEYLVTAIVSTYNSERFIRGCLEDLENQTIAGKLEIIVVNSGSQQNEDAVVRGFQGRYSNIKYIKTDHRETIYQAWNRAVKAASGKYITNANTDDRHRADAFEKMAAALDANPDKVLVYADQVDVKEMHGRRIEIGKRINGPFLRERLFEGECPPGSQPMWRVQVHQSVGYFDEAFAISGDYEFWFRLTQRHDFLYLDECLGERLIDTEAMSCANSDLLGWENMIIDTCYRYAQRERIEVGDTGLSNHPDFRDWPQVNIWRARVKARLSGRPVSLADNVKNVWDCRTNPAPKLTVVLVTCRRQHQLFQALDSLNGQTEKNFEVIVAANDGDLSALREKAESFAFGLCGVELEHNYGPSPPRNKASELAKAPYIAFMDDDVVADRDMVRNIIGHFQETQVLGLRGRVLPKRKDDCEPSPANYDLGDSVIATACEVSSLSAYRKDVFAAVGGFDEILFGSEGIELSYRICKRCAEKTKSIWYFPDVIVYHDARQPGPAQTEKALRQRWMDLLACRKDPDLRGYWELVRSLYPGGCGGAVESNYAWVVNVAMCIEKNFPEEAVEWARKANALRSDGAKGCYVLGSLRVRLGDYNQAAPLLERILQPLQQALAEGGGLLVGTEFESRDEIAHCYIRTCTLLAQCYLHKGDYEKVRQVYGYLLDNPHVTIPPDQHTRICTVMERLPEAPAPRAAVESKGDAPAPAGRQDRYLVSAIVSTYNAEKFLSGCLEDLENQTIAGKLEIIVVNSGSQENEEQIVRQYQQKYDNIVYIKTEHRERIYAAWNRAIKVARGTFLTNANTDDRHRQDALEIMANTLEANPNVALVYGNQIRTDTPNDTFDNHHGTEMLQRPEYSRQRLLFGCCVGSQPMWRRSLHNEFGFFDETLTCAGDWDFWLRLSSQYEFIHIPTFLGLYYYNKNGIEHSKKIHSLYERYLVGKRYGNPYISVIPLYESKDNPLVSVIMPAFNAAKYITEAIESVLIQNYKNFELIVVDDGSTDNTKNIVTSFKDERIKCFYKDQGGPSSARNLAISKATGQYILPLDADDMMTPDFITKHLREFEKHPENDLVYCDVMLIDVDGSPIKVMKKPEYKDRRCLIRDLFRAGHPVVPFRLGIRRSVFDKIGLYDESLLIGEDYDMMRRFVKAGLKAHHLAETLHLRRMSPNSLSRNYSLHKARCHYDVIKRFIDTFTYDELFPDIVWHGIPTEERQLHAKCMLVTTYLSMGQDFIRAKAPPAYARMAFEEASAQLRDCVGIAPNNRQIRQLLQKCERVKQNYKEELQQAILHDEACCEV